MKFEAKRLQYPLDALEAALAKQEVDIHYNKHTKAYFKKVNELVVGTAFAKAESLEAILKRKTLNIDTPIYNNVAQAYNHDFYWQCLTPDKTERSEQLEQAIVKDFGSFEKFKKEVTEKGTNFFGSGWLWVVQEGGKIKILTLPNAQTPATNPKQNILLAIDLWEHSYLYQEEYFANRKKYLENIWRVINWYFVSENYKKANVV